MGKTYWTASVAIACIFWGVAVLFNQHHLSTLIPVLGTYLLTYGIGLLVVLWLHGRRS